MLNIILVNMLLIAVSLVCSLSPSTSRKDHSQLRFALLCRDERAFMIGCISVNMTAHQRWTEDRVRLAALAELAQLVLTERVNTALV